jgi:hypothetical protein
MARPIFKVLAASSICSFEQCSFAAKRITRHKCQTVYRYRKKSSDIGLNPDDSGFGKSHVTWKLRFRRV